MTAAEMRADLERWRAQPADDLADIRARLGAATPGPWQAREDEVRWERVYCIVDAEDCAVCADASPADAELIAHAPGDLRRLLDEVARLRIEAGYGAPEGWAYCSDAERPGCDLLRRVGDLSASVWTRPERGVALWWVWRDDGHDGALVAEGECADINEAIRAAEAWLAGQEGA